MKIVFTGLPYFGKKLVDELSSFDHENTYRFYNTYYARIDKLRFFFQVLNADLVVSFNGASAESGALNWAIKRNKKLIMFWHGSDVLTAKNNQLKGTLVNKYIKNALHFTDAVWLQKELIELEIEAEILPFKFVESTSNIDDFNDTNIVTYIAQGNENFYGIQTIYHCAKDWPEKTFHVIGTDGSTLEKFPNIVYHGWLNAAEVKKLLNQHAIFIRFTKHDGYSLSVMEAIANGNHVFWNYPHEAVNFVKDAEQLKVKLAELLNDSNQPLKRNVNGINWAKQNLDKNAILKNFIDTLIRHGK